MIEQAANHNRNAAQIFLEEWSTMGRKRPTLGLLLDLLVKADLFRAADYLACDILKRNIHGSKIVFSSFKDKLILFFDYRGKAKEAKRWSRSFY